MKLKYDLHIVSIGDGAVAVPVGETAESFRSVIECNDTAAFILQQLKQQTTESMIVQRVKEEYDAQDNAIQDYVHRFITKLYCENLLE